MMLPSLLKLGLGKLTLIMAKLWCVVVGLSLSKPNSMSHCGSIQMFWKALKRAAQDGRLELTMH